MNFRGKASHYVLIQECRKDVRKIRSARRLKVGRARNAVTFNSLALSKIRIGKMWRVEAKELPTTPALWVYQFYQKKYSIE